MWGESASISYKDTDARNVRRIPNTLITIRPILGRAFQCGGKKEKRETGLTCFVTDSIWSLKYPAGLYMKDINLKHFIFCKHLLVQWCDYRYDTSIFRKLGSQLPDDGASTVDITLFHLPGAMPFGKRSVNCNIHDAGKRTESSFFGQNCQTYREIRNII